MTTEIEQIVKKLVELKPSVKGGLDPIGPTILPASTKARFDRHGVDYSKGYPEIPPSDELPVFLDEAELVRNEPFPVDDRGKYADPEKKALFGAATEVIDLTKHIGTEIVGLQLSDLNEKQKDELALLIAERVVVFFRDQDLAPQKQLELGKYYGPVEIHPQAPRVPLGEGGVSVIWADLVKAKNPQVKYSNKRSGGAAHWHTDLTHELQPPGITHLHNDTIPKIGGDTTWVSGYAAYDKLSPALQEFLDGKYAVFTSRHSYTDRENPLKGAKPISRRHPIVRTHPVTGWKSLFLNRGYTTEIEGLEPGESKIILEYLFGVFEKNLDIQVRFNWKPTKPGLGTSALWDNRVSQHYAIFDYEGLEPRHGTRVTSLAEVPFLDPNSKSQRESLGLTVN